LLLREMRFANDQDADRCAVAVPEARAAAGGLLRSWTIVGILFDDL